MESVGEQKQYPEMHEGWIADFYMKNTTTGERVNLVRGAVIKSIDGDIVHLEDAGVTPNGKLSFDVSKDDIVSVMPPESKMAA